MSATTTALRCVCARHTDGSVTTFICPAHADNDPCLTESLVTGRRRKGTVRRGVCTSCGHGSGRPWIDVRTMNNPGTPRAFRRVFLYCPSGHECVSAPVENHTGRKLLAGDFSDEWCGNTSCGWSA